MSLPICLCLAEQPRADCGWLPPSSSEHKTPTLLSLKFLLPVFLRALILSVMATGSMPRCPN